MEFSRKSDPDFPLGEFIAEPVAKWSALQLNENPDNRSALLNYSSYIYAYGFTNPFTTGLAVKHFHFHTDTR